MVDESPESHSCCVRPGRNGRPCILCDPVFIHDFWILFGGLGELRDEIRVLPEFLSLLMFSDLIYGEIDDGKINKLFDDRVVSANYTVNQGQMTHLTNIVSTA